MQNNSSAPAAGTNPYQAPSAALLRDDMEGENTSGMGKGHPVPDGVKGWSWGAFLLNWIWAIGNRTWIGLLCFIPYVGLIFAFVLGFKGREWAWQNKHWNSVEHFQRVQRTWSMWGAILILGSMALGILAAILIPVLSRH
jgi:hypothetical protein